MRCTRSGFLAVYLAGLVVGNRQTRAHNSVIVFLDAITWLAQIVMFVLLGLLVWPHRLADSLIGAIVVALVLMLVARPVAVFLCLAPFKFPWREKLFISWVGLRGAVGDLSRLDPAAGRHAGGLYLFRRRLRRRAVVASGAGLDGGALGPQARHLVCAQRSAAAPRRARSARPVGARDRRLSGAAPTVRICAAASFRTGRGRLWSCATRKSSRRRRPSRCARATMSICWRRRKRRRRSTASSSNMPPPASPDPALLGDFFVPGTATLGALAEIYGLQVAADHTEVTLADLFTENLGRPARTGDIVQLGPIALLAHKVENGRVTTVGLRLAEPEEPATCGRARQGILGRACRSGSVSAPSCGGEPAPGCAARRPGAAEQHAGPEQVAEHGLVEERQRRDVALRQAGQVIGYMPLKAQTAKFDSTKNSSETRQHGRGRPAATPLQRRVSDAEQRPGWRSRA